MHVKDALGNIIDESGISRYAIARQMGKNQNFVYTMLDRPTYPGFATLSKIADICGYDLALVKRDGSRTIILDKPE